MDRKESKAYKKMNAEQVQQLLAFRRKGYVAKNGKAYSRKVKHKKSFAE